MKIPKKVTVIANEKEYSISKTVWDHYCEMHSKRSEDALASDIRKNYLLDNIEPTSADVEAMIMEEYDALMQLNIPQLIQEARSLYESCEQTNY